MFATKFPSIKERVEPSSRKVLIRWDGDSKPIRSWSLAPAIAAWIAFALSWGRVPPVAAASCPPAAQAETESAEALVSKLGDESPDARGDAARRILALALDLSYAISKGEELQGSGDSDLRTRASRIVRLLRDAAGVQITHERLGSVPPQLCAEFLKIPLNDSPRPGEEGLAQRFSLPELTGPGGLDGEGLMAEIIRLNPDLWHGRCESAEASESAYRRTPVLVLQGPTEHCQLRWDAKHSVLDVSGSRELRDLVGRCVDTWKGETKEQRLPVRHAVDAIFQDLGGSTSSERDRAEARIGALRDAFNLTHAALKKAAETADAEVKFRADALLGQMTVSFRRHSSHGAYRRAAVAQIRAKEAGLEPSRLPDLVRSTFQPCKTTDVRILNPQSPELSEQTLRDLQAGEGIIDVNCGPVPPGRELLLGSKPLVFSLPSRKAPRLFVWVTFEQ